MKGTVVKCIIVVLCLAALFMFVYNWRSSTLGVEKPMTQEEVQEVDDKKIKKISVKIGDKTYTDLDELDKHITSQDKKVICDVEYNDGTKKEDIEGYVSYGDDNYAEMHGNFVHIVVRR